MFKDFQYAMLDDFYDWYKFARSSKSSRISTHYSDVNDIRMSAIISWICVILQEHKHKDSQGCECIAVYDFWRFPWTSIIFCIMVWFQLFLFYYILPNYWRSSIASNTSNGWYRHHFLQTGFLDFQGFPRLTVFQMISLIPHSISKSAQIYGWFQ